MDYELVKYMQPFFVEETQHWFKVLRKKPVAPLMVKFVDGMVLRKVRNVFELDQYRRNPRFEMLCRWSLI